MHSVATVVSSTSATSATSATCDALYCVCFGFRDVVRQHFTPRPCKHALHYPVCVCDLDGSSGAERVLKLQTMGDF